MNFRTLSHKEDSHKEDSIPRNFIFLLLTMKEREYVFRYEHVMDMIISMQKIRKKNARRNI